MHIRFSGSICKIGGSSYYDSGHSMNRIAPRSINKMSLTLKYKTTTSTSWTTKTLISNLYDIDANIDKMLTNITLEAESSYDIVLEFKDNWKTYTKSFSFRAPIILIDYNQSGKSLSFGKKSDATSSDTIIESILPIIFSDNVNKVSSLNSGITALITECGTNSSQYYNIFVQRTSSGSRAYGITCMDTDSSGNAIMRLNCFQSRLDIKYRSMQFYQWSSDYYWEVNPESTYCNMNTNSTYFYFNKPIYINGNQVATQSWVTGQSYATKSSVNEKCSLSGNSKSELSNHNSLGTQNKLYLGKNGETIFQVHWGYSSIGNVPSSYDGQYCVKSTISFSPGFGKVPVVIATPQISRDVNNNKHWKCTCSIASVSTSSVTIDVTAEGWTGTARVYWFAIGAY